MIWGFCFPGEDNGILWSEMKGSSVWRMKKTRVLSSIGVMELSEVVPSDRWTCSLVYGGLIEV